MSIRRALWLPACAGYLLACGGVAESQAMDAASDATSDAPSEASHDAAPEAAFIDPSCPKDDGGEPSSWTVGPGDPCTIEDTQCFSYVVVGATWMRCCSGKWRAIPNDAGSFACPK